MLSRTAQERPAAAKLREGTALKRVEEALMGSPSRESLLAAASDEQSHWNRLLLDVHKKYESTMEVKRYRMLYVPLVLRSPSAKQPYRI